jgi:hypothetical protein
MKTKKPEDPRSGAGFFLVKNPQEERELCPPKPMAKEGEASNPLFQPLTFHPITRSCYYLYTSLKS